MWIRSPSDPPLVSKHTFVLSSIQHPELAALLHNCRFGEKSQILLELLEAGLRHRNSAATARQPQPQPSRPARPRASAAPSQTVAPAPSLPVAPSAPVEVTSQTGATEDVQPLRAKGTPSSVGQFLDF